MKLNKVTKPGYYQDMTNENILFHIFPDDSKRVKDTSNQNKLVVEQLECIDIDDNDRRIYEIADDTFLYVKNAEPIDVEETDIKLIDYMVYDYIEDKPTYKQRCKDLIKQIKNDLERYDYSGSIDCSDIRCDLRDYLRMLGEEIC